MMNASLVLLTTLLGFPEPAPAPQVEQVELAGIQVVPHVASPELRFRRDPSPEMSARVQVFLRSATQPPVPIKQVTVAGKTPNELVQQGDWAWHDFPDFDTTEQSTPPAGQLLVWTWNGATDDWGQGTSHELNIATGAHAAQKLQLELKPPRVWISSLTFLGSHVADTPRAVAPDRYVAHIANDTDEPITLVAAKLWCASDRQRWNVLSPYEGRHESQFFPADGITAAHDRSAIEVRTGNLPLTYAALEVTYRDRNGRMHSLWTYQRIKRESFDISGGWTQLDVPNRNPMTFEPYLKLLRQLHVNTAQIDEFPGYTDQPELYAKYPIKYFNRCQPLEKYDTDSVLPRIHAVEFLGEPQFRGSRGYKTPAGVYEALLPYRSSRLATSVTLSDASTWRLYAGLSDYPHYDAYRVTAPMADAWSRYDRWDGQSIRWGAPLETIGTMCRSLREMSRPMPIAYWSQGPHHDWRGMAGRKRGSPTPAEIRSQAYHGLASRVTSLYWFNLSLRSLMKYPDTWEELQRIGREIRVLDDLLLEGDAYHHRIVKTENRLDWDLSVVASPRAAICFANDLSYTPNQEQSVFDFSPPRAADFAFPLPAYLRKPAAVVRIDADGIRDVKWEATPDGISIRDEASLVAVYIALQDSADRQRLQEKRLRLVEFENSFGYDPIRRSEDLQILRDYLP